MFASLLRSKRQRGQIEQTSFATPSLGFRDAHNNPRRVHRADESSDDAPGLQGIDEGDMDEEDWEEDEEEEEEDGPLESTPLLPMFSASHLGRKKIPGCRLSVVLWCCGRLLTMIIRCATRLQYDPCHSSPYCLPLRNHPDMGSIALTASLPISDQTDPTEDYVGPLLARNPLCFNGQLFAIWKGNAFESRK